MINVYNVVNVNFQIVNTQTSIGAYRTAAYMLPTTTSVDVQAGNGLVPIVGQSIASDGTVITNDNLTDIVSASVVLCTSAEDVRVAFNSNSAYASYIYNATMFFNQGGQQLALCVPSAYTQTALEASIELARILSNDLIYVCIPNSLIITDGTTGYTLAACQSIANWMQGKATGTNGLLLAPNTLRLCLTATGTDGVVSSTVKTEEFNEYESVFIAYTSKKINSVYIDEALLFAAYTTNIDLDGSETIKDYCYTPFNITGYSVDAGTDVAPDKQAENVSQLAYTNLIKANYNFIDNIAGTNCVFGGNLANGVQATIDFGNVCAENDIASAVLSVMLQKQYLTSGGANNVKSEINSRLLRYTTNGYLNMGANYSGNDLTKNYNGRKFSIVANNAVLDKGFYVYIVPMIYISATDKAAKKFTPIYVIMETQAGARVVDISGEVR